MQRIYAAIDLKSFYASVECSERGLDPLATNLVVADSSRTDKTICLAISPSLKAYGLPGRARLFQVREKVREINLNRRQKTSFGLFLGKSYSSDALAQNPNLALDFIVATPRMQYYLDYSAKIYNIYLRFISPENILAYSIDEVFCDITDYLKIHHCSAEEFITKIVKTIEAETKITATAGIGTNLFLAKVAMDILAKHAEPNSAGVRIAKLDEQIFRATLWAHEPITDFWRIGRGYAKRLASHNIYTMGDVARCSIKNQKLLYDLFGINAELLIDHSWGFENVTISDVKNHQPETKSLSSGQVLSRPYTFNEAKVIIREMAESLALDLVQKGYLSDHYTLFVTYAHTNVSRNSVTDHYNRRMPKPAQGTKHTPTSTSASSIIITTFLELFSEKVNPEFTIHKITLGANNLISEKEKVINTTPPEQIDLFTDYHNLTKAKNLARHRLKKERRIQKAILKIRERYGKNAILRGTNFEPSATERNRHNQIGGHRA